jgi:DNA-binding FadR family transcriptional regulator
LRDVPAAVTVNFEGGGSVTNFDDELILELGLGALCAESRVDLLEQMRLTLELRVGEVLAAQMSEEQLDEFEEIFDRQDDEDALRWVSDNFPDHERLVEAAYVDLKAEVRRSAYAIVAAEDSSWPG